MKQIRLFVGMDVRKETISISIAEHGRSGPVRFIGVIPNTLEAVQRWRSSSQGMVSSTPAMKRAGLDTAFITSSQGWDTSAPWRRRR